MLHIIRQEIQATAKPLISSMAGEQHTKTLFLGERADWVRLRSRWGNHKYPYKKILAPPIDQDADSLTADSSREDSSVPPLPGYKGFHRKADRDIPSRRFQNPGP